MTVKGSNGRHLVLAALASVLGASTGCMHKHVRTLDAFRAAKESGDYVTAATYLAADARIWFGKKEGEGRPLTAQGGSYKEWDREFKSNSSRKRVRASASEVSYISQEQNDFYRLIDGQMGPARITYYFNDDGKIGGMLYRGLAKKGDLPPNRRCEFERWAAEKYPGLLDSEEMQIPNNPQRWRELLVEWRAEVGLQPYVTLEGKRFHRR